MSRDFAMVSTLVEVDGQALEDSADIPQCRLLFWWGAPGLLFKDPLVHAVFPQVKLGS